MKKYSVARARQHFSEILDGAEAGATVMIERRGRLFSVQSVDAADKRRTAPKVSAFEWLDPLVVSGTWTWTQTDKGWQFAQLPQKRRQRTKR